MRTDKNQEDSTNTNEIRLSAEGVVRLPVVLSFFPVSKSTWWAGVKSGRYPTPVRLGPRAVGWKVQDIRALF